MKNVYLFQPQYPFVVNDKVNYWIPYSVGVLWNYAVQFNDIGNSFLLKEFIFKREPINDILNRIENPIVCGFSAYVWNIKYCLTVAEQIKKRYPICQIIFGGPEVSARYTSFEFIDSIILGEGEQAFVESLKNVLHNRPLERILSKQRMQDLSNLGPYSSGIFDHLLDQHPDVLWNVTLETNRGCPYSCTFCDWGSLTYSKIKKFNLETVKKEIDWIRKKPVSYVFVADANFGIYKDRDLEIARLLKSASDDSAVDVVNFQNAKNSNETVFKIEQILDDKSAGVTFSFQSLNPNTLKAIKRTNLSINDSKKIIELSKTYNISTYSELILGLPEETFTSWCEGLCELLEMGQHTSIEVWFTQLLENSELSTKDLREKYNICSNIVNNYYSASTETYDEVIESIELIVSTSTMTTEDMIDSYIYSWMILQLHIAGYSEIIAKYCRFAKNISYKLFYDNLFTSIQNESIIKEKYNYLRNTVSNFLYYGTLDKSINGHLLHTILNHWISDNQTMIIEFVYRSIKSLSDVPSWVVDLQINYCRTDLDQNLLLKGNYNIIDQKNETVNYVIGSKHLQFTDLSVRSRRVNKKNTLSIIRI